MTHTPRPWSYWVTRSGRLAEVAAVGGPRLLELSKHRNPNFEDDARLIAAAPDLLEACKELLGCVENAALMYTPEDDEDDEIAEIIASGKYAIAKAEGTEEGK